MTLSSTITGLAVSPLDPGDTQFVMLIPATLPQPLHTQMIRLLLPRLDRRLRLPVGNRDTKTGALSGRLDTKETGLSGGQHHHQLCSLRVSSGILARSLSDLTV